MTGQQIKSEIFAYLKRKGWILEKPGESYAWRDPNSTELTPGLYMFHAAFVVELSREITPGKAA